MCKKEWWAKDIWHDGLAAAQNLSQMSSVTLTFTLALTVAMMWWKSWKEVAYVWCFAWLGEYFNSCGLGAFLIHCVRSWVWLIPKASSDLSNCFSTVPPEISSRNLANTKLLDVFWSSMLFQGHHNFYISTQPHESWKILLMSLGYIQ